jgi:PAS domain S-box-containing protein
MGWHAAAMAGLRVGESAMVLGSAPDSLRRSSHTEGATPYDVALRLAAIVESSDDAILTKDLQGRITSWNNGAQRIFGYTADEVIGRPVTVLIPADRLDEEPGILARIGRGERIDHYETVRQRKDGRLINISLTVSPLRDPSGKIIGASKVARDITERHQAQERQKLLVREMDHRIKNLFALTSSIVTICARTAKSPQDLAHDVAERLTALAQAHSLTVRPPIDESGPLDYASLQHLVDAILAPYRRKDTEWTDTSIEGPDLRIPGHLIPPIALVVHELATNAAKYGGLSVASGTVSVRCVEETSNFVLLWNESGGPPVHEFNCEGFGSVLLKAAVGQLGGRLSREATTDGISVRLVLPRTLT